VSIVREAEALRSLRLAESEVFLQHTAPLKSRCDTSGFPDAVLPKAAKPGAYQPRPIPFMGMETLACEHCPRSLIDRP
jgi:hypothetical protein